MYSKCVSALLISASLHVSCCTAGDFFVDTFDDGDAADDQPVTWISNFGGGGSADSGDYTFTRSNPGCCLGAVIDDQIYSDASVRTRISPGPYFLAGITARGPVGGAGLDWYFAGVRADRIIGIFSGGRLIGRHTLPPEPEFVFDRDDVNLQFDMNGNTLSLRAWLNDDPVPTEPQVQVEATPDMPFYSDIGRLGIWHNSINSGDPPPPVSFRHFEVQEYVDHIHVGGSDSIGSESFDQRANLAIGGTATSSSVDARSDPSNAIDGLWSTIARTDRRESMHWWQVDLGQEQGINRVEIVNDTANGRGLVDGGGFRLSVLDAAGDSLHQQDLVDLDYAEPLTIDLSEVGPLNGQSVRLEKLDPVQPSTRGRFSLREVRVMGDDFVATSSTSLAFEIDPANGQSDVLQVPGVFDLRNPRINVTSLSGSAQPGDVFRLIEADAITGELGQVDLPGLDSGLVWDTTSLAVDGTIAVADPFDCNGDRIVDAGDLACVTTIQGRDGVLEAIDSFPGDLDGSNGVNFDDFLKLSANFGMEGDYADGNVDMVGSINFDDFLELSQNFGKGGGLGVAAAVPEPSAFVLFGFGLFAVAVQRKNKRSISFNPSNGG